MEALPEQPAASAPCFCHEAYCKERLEELRGWIKSRINAGALRAPPPVAESVPSRAEPSPTSLSSARHRLGTRAFQSLGEDRGVENQEWRLGREARPWSWSHSLKVSTGYNESRSCSLQAEGGREEFNTLLVGIHWSLSRSLRESNVCLCCLQPSQGIPAQPGYGRVGVSPQKSHLSPHLQNPTRTFRATKNVEQPEHSTKPSCPFPDQDTGWDRLEVPSRSTHRGAAPSSESELWACWFPSDACVTVTVSKNKAEF